MSTQPHRLARNLLCAVFIHLPYAPARTTSPLLCSQRQNACLDQYHYNIFAMFLQRCCNITIRGLQFHNLSMSLQDCGAICKFATLLQCY